MKVEKDGDWDKVNTLVNNLQKELKMSQLLALKRMGLLAEKIAVTHISKQDLGWKSLSSNTISEKIRLGYSEDILVRTSTYFQSITTYVKEDVSYTGVRKNVTDDNGNVVADIAAVHEFGSVSANIPKRELWKPTMKESSKIIVSGDKFDPRLIFLKRIRKYL